MPVRSTHPMMAGGVSIRSASAKMRLSDVDFTAPAAECFVVDPAAEAMDHGKCRDLVVRVPPDNLPVPAR